jgi:hypothetical protein
MKQQYEQTGFVYFVIKRQVAFSTSPAFREWVLVR